MAKQRTTLRAEDLVNGALVYSPATGKTYQLGPPVKKNVNRNVVNHCQLHYQNGKLAGPGKWLNLSNLRKLGFKYVGTPQKPAAASLVVEKGPAGPGKEVAGE
jgi:hypothetical protein